MASFDAYAAIDWSGAKAQQTRAIAVAQIASNDTHVALVAPPAPQLLWSRQAVAEWIAALAVQPGRTFIGIDANLGYASDIVTRQFTQARNAFDLWHHVDDASRDQPDFYAEGFWTHPNIAAYFWTQGQKPKDWHGAQRQTEIVCGQQNHGHPESPFKLIGPKQVGKGGLSAMRMAHHLRRQLGMRIAFWPFDTADTIAGAHVVMGEIYPRLFICAAGMGQGKLRTAQDLLRALDFWGASSLISAAYSDHQSDALVGAAGLRGLFAAQKDPLFLPPTLHHAVRLEGWITGVAPPEGS